MTIEWDPFDDSDETFDLANEFSDLLDLDQLSLVPAVGVGWHFIIKSALSQMREVMQRENLVGLVLIGDIKEKRARLEISWLGCSEHLDAIERELEEVALITCAHCGATHCDEHRRS